MTLLTVIAGKRIAKPGGLQVIVQVFCVPVPSSKIRIADALVDSSDPLDKVAFAPLVFFLALGLVLDAWLKPVLETTLDVPGLLASLTATLASETTLADEATFRGTSAFMSSSRSFKRFTSFGSSFSTFAELSPGET